MLKDLPKTLLSFFGKIACLLLSLMGIETSATGLFFKFLPTKAILQWLVSFLAVFFPMLAPVLSLGSKYLG
jgi:hypothetical protein